MGFMKNSNNLISVPMLLSLSDSNLILNWGFYHIVRGVESQIQFETNETGVTETSVCLRMWVGHKLLQ